MMILAVVITGFIVIGKFPGIEVSRASATRMIPENTGFRSGISRSSTALNTRNRHGTALPKFIGMAGPGINGSRVWHMKIPNCWEEPMR